MIALYRAIIGEDITKDGMEELGRQLAQVMGRKNPYSYRYIRSLIKGDKGFKQPSKRLRQAMDRLLAGQLDGHRVTNVTAIGNVAPGSLILADSKVCAYGPCEVNFVGRAWNSKYCSDGHKLAARRLARQVRQ